MAISQLVRIALTSIAMQSLERTLAQSEPSPVALASLQRELEKEIDVPILVYMARGDRAGQYRLMSGLIDGSAHVSQFGGAPSDRPGRIEQWQEAIMARRAIPKMLKYMTDFVEAGRLPPEQQRERIQRIDAVVLDRTHIEDVLLGLLLPAFNKLALATIRQQAMLRCAIVAVAAERYRLDHGRWPAAIAELTPKYLAAVPLDPFDGQPLRWRNDLRGVTIYSVGYDGVDNGRNLDRIHLTQPGVDIGFRLWDVRARRQPAVELAPMPREVGEKTGP